MPVVLSNPIFPNQVGFGGQQSYSTELNFRQMITDVTTANPNVDPMVAARWINYYYRTVIDRRSWYGLKLRGQIIAPTVVNTGQATVTYNSNVVTGANVGTPGWTAALIGLQFRAGFTFPYQTIVNVPVPSPGANPVLILDTPFGGQTQVGSYQIVAAYFTMGGNIKRLLWAVNQQQGWPLEVNFPVQTVNAWDVWRQSLGWTTVLATRPPTPDGQYQVEAWPTPFQNQVFPFEAYQQPAELVNDNDSIVSWLRADIIVGRAVARALVHEGPKKNPYYDAQESQRLVGEFNAEIERMEQADNDMDQQDVTWDYGFEDGRIGFGPGSTWNQMHDV